VSKPCRRQRDRDNFTSGVKVSVKVGGSRLKVVVCELVLLPCVERFFVTPSQMSITPENVYVE
jgi:hypothetical protein